MRTRAEAFASACASGTISMSELAPVTLARTSPWNPVLIPTVRIMTAMPMMMPSTAMSTMGRESRSCRSLSRMIRRAVKCANPIGRLAAKIGRAARLAGPLLALCACQEPLPAQNPAATPGGVSGHANAQIRVGAQRTAQYLPLLRSKRVAVVTNPTGMIGGTHLVDSLLALQVDVVKVFAPEHGFRGEADAGEHVASGRDQRTGLPLVSLYGKNKKPAPEQLQDVDV